METDTTYTPPVMLEEIDDEVIHARMMEALPGDIDKTEGGFAYDFTKPAALEKASMMVDLNEAIQLFFPAWSYGVWLDQIASTVGLSRKAANPATGVLTIKGVEGTTIAAGFLFATPSTSANPNIEFEATETVVIGSSLYASVPVKCVEAGPVGNVPANSVTLMVSPIGGIATITNESAFTGGADEEDDDTLRERIQERDLDSEASFVGNISDYRRWAKEVSGVGDVIVMPEWMGKGTGTIKLIIMDSNGSPANQTILDAVYEYIMSPEDEDGRKAPVGAILTVATAQLVVISIGAEVLLEDGADVGTVTAAFKSAFEAYFAEAKTEGAVRYTRVGSILSMTEGIVDYASLTLNGASANIAIDKDEYPGTGDISLVVAT
jgi:uncharacterized phage protein gp47/JayE